MMKLNFKPDSASGGNLELFRIHSMIEKQKCQTLLTIFIEPKYIFA